MADGTRTHRAGGGGKNRNPNLRDVNVAVEGAHRNQRQSDLQKNEDIHPSTDEKRTHSQDLLWGGEHGVLALVIDQDKFFDETGKQWVVPETQGAFPTIAGNESAVHKQKTISKFIQEETDILSVEVAKELLKGQFMESIEECYCWFYWVLPISRVP